MKEILFCYQNPINFVSMNATTWTIFFAIVLLGCVEINGQVTITSNKNLQRLVDSNRLFKLPTPGFRVILGFESEKTSIDSLKQFFQLANPKVEAYVFFESPNFKLAVGDFRTEIEAKWFSKNLPPHYPLNLVQKMPINLPRID